MNRRSRIAICTLLCSTAAAPAAAAPTQQFVAGAELLRQPKGQPWDLNLITGATFGTDDGSPLSPVTKMRLSFPGGARFNGDKFPTCTAAQVDKEDCPKGSQIGKGTAVAQVGKSQLDATVLVFNGPGTASKRKIFMLTKALSTVRVVLTGDMRKTSGTYGYVLDLTVPPIVPDLQPGGVPIAAFDTTIGGAITKRGKRIPLVTSPSSCSGGWKFSAQFTYASGATGTVNSQIPCKLLATPVS